ncbi:helix-turn-helix domain-containing protein [Paenibacillus macerans]|uniref:helix-turn-helix domain-containing protein n=1 Tax=Paenibacillus macerans TaxID=44252 RepID=UPI003D314571
MKNFDQLPDLLTAQNVADYISISRRRVYELFQLPVDRGGIPCIEIGATKRVYKHDLAKWLSSKKPVESEGVTS